MTKRITMGLAAMLLAMTTAFAQAPGNAQAGQNGPGNMRRGHAMRGMANYLQLSDTQRQQMKDVREQARTQSQPYIQQVQNARAEVEKLVQSGAAPEQVQKRAEELAAANGTAVQKLAGIHAWTAAKMYSILTPEQREKAQEFRKSFGGKFGGFGFMGSHGRPAAKAQRGGASL